MGYLGFFNALQKPRPCGKRRASSSLFRRCSPLGVQTAPLGCERHPWTCAAGCRWVIQGATISQSFKQLVTSSLLAEGSTQRFHPVIFVDLCVLHREPNNQQLSTNSNQMFLTTSHNNPSFEEVICRFVCHLSKLWLPTLSCPRFNKLGWHCNADTSVEVGECPSKSNIEPGKEQLFSTR